MHIRQECIGSIFVSDAYRMRIPGPLRSILATQLMGLICVVKKVVFICIVFMHHLQDLMDTFVASDKTNGARGGCS